MLQAGQPAPDFTVLTDAGSFFRLSDHRGKPVVLYFYPKDFTIGCTKEACDFRDNYSEIVAQGAALVGVSADPPESHRRFKDKYALPFPLAADPDLAVARLYGAERRFPFPGLQRVTYVIGRDGIIHGAFRHELAIGRHQDDVLAALKRLNKDAPRAADGHAR